MRDWLKSYLLEKSIEALGESRTEPKEDSPASGKSKWPEVEQRKYERVSVHLPVVYQIGTETITGTTVNVCNEGMMVESHLPSKRVLKVFDILSGKEGYRLEIKCFHDTKICLRDGEVEHFHIASSVKGSCRLTVGFWVRIMDE